MEVILNEDLGQFYWSTDTKNWDKILDTHVSSAFTETFYVLIKI